MGVLYVYSSISNYRSTIQYSCCNLRAAYAFMNHSLFTSPPFFSQCTVSEILRCTVPLRCCPPAPAPAIQFWSMGLISRRITIGPQQSRCRHLRGKAPATAPSWNGAKARRQPAFDRGQLAMRPAAARPRAETEAHVSRLLGACLANGHCQLIRSSVATDHPVQFLLLYLFLVVVVLVKQKRRAKCKSHLGRHRRREEIYFKRYSFAVLSVNIFFCRKKKVNIFLMQVSLVLLMYMPSV